MSKLATVFGGSGFLGRYIVRRLAKAGWRVRVAVRNPNDAGFVRPYGVVGQVEPVFCNIRDDASVRAVMKDADAVVNCVGILAESGKQSFDTVQAEAPERIARVAAEEGVDRMVHISAIGADRDSASDYARTKAIGEEGVLRHMPQAMILRPSIVFGQEDAFFNRFARMVRFSPFLPLVGPDTKFQPVYVDDVAAAAMKGIAGQAEPGIYELGGPDVNTFRGLMKQMLKVIYRRRIVLGLPFWLGSVMGRAFDLLNTISLGLISGPITLDQVRNLRQDNVVHEGAKTFADLGIEPTSLEAVLPEYLWPYRPSGQYAEMKASAKRLNGT